MNDAIRAVILGIVEGLTEFLPISSTGHMILIGPWLGISEDDPFWKTFFIFIQLGAILSVVIYFWRRLWRLIVTPGPGPISEHMLVKLAVAFLPAAIIGKLAGSWIKGHLMQPLVVAGALIVGGLLIIAIERRNRHPKVLDAANVPLRFALLIGFAQCVAMIPGTSRSAATIMGALLLGLSAPAAAEFSFFLAIPTMFAAGTYELYKARHDLVMDQAAILGLGFAVAFVVALAVIAAFMRFIQTHRFTAFAIYRIILGAVVIAWFRFAPA